MILDPRCNNNWKSCRRTTSLWIWCSGLTIVIDCIYDENVIIYIYINGLKAGDRLVAVNEHDTVNVPAKVSMRLLSILPFPKILVFQTKYVLLHFCNSGLNYGLQSHFKWSKDCRSENTVKNVQHDNILPSSSC
jgi:hypothetical protein